ncbi:MAG: hypothetical protein KDA88_08510 [Planctomycetaceae bacterium]|nr:hypothetical protein [Planctomycetaceae bacterium]MCB9950616.1 hypothetical protein [Planctomycetaceae bacterium]
MEQIALVRYGVVPEVARFAAAANASFERGEQLVVQTDRGPQLGIFLEWEKPSVEPRMQPEPPAWKALRATSQDDLEQAEQCKQRAAAGFAAWEQRIEQWQLELQLIEIEFTLDQSREILYVLNERGPDCTKLAIQAAASGFGVIEVQPVSATGLVTLPTSGGCGSGGGGCGSGGCHHG